MKKMLAVLSGVAFTFISMQSQAGFVKYKDYLIPVGGACEASAIPASAPNPVDSGKARVFITTDIDGGDPDDKQSLAHILAFADKVEIEGFSTSDPNQGNSIHTGVAFIKNAINAYSKDLPKLKLVRGSGAFSDPNLLKEEVYKGSTTLGNANGGGWGESAGADAIIKAVRCAYRNGNKKPLYVLTWGTSSEAVRAMEKAPDIIKYLRVVSYSDHNNENRQIAVNNYLKRIAKSKALWWIDYPINNSSIRPLHRCTDSSINLIKSKGYLGRIIDINNDLFNFCSDGKGFKLGDTVTTMFVFNSASQRNNPVVTTWGNYNKSTSVGSNYWKLKIENFKGKDAVYSTWKDRVSGL